MLLCTILMFSSSLSHLLCTLPAGEFIEILELRMPNPSESKLRPFEICVPFHRTRLRISLAIERIIDGLGPIRLFF